MNRYTIPNMMYDTPTGLSVTPNLQVMNTLGSLACIIWLLIVGDWRFLCVATLVGLVGGIVFLSSMKLKIRLHYKEEIALRTLAAQNTLDAQCIVLLIAHVIFWTLLIAWSVFCMFCVVSVTGMSETTIIPRLLTCCLMVSKAILNLWVVDFKTGLCGSADFIPGIFYVLSYIVVAVLFMCGIELSLLTIGGVLFGTWVISTSLCAVIFDA